MQSDNPENRPAAAPGNLPVLLLALTLVVWFGFQIFQALKAREELTQAIAAQEPQLQSAEQVKQSLLNLALATKRLAVQGNANAQQVVDSLAQRGVNIENPPVAGQVSQTLQR